MTCVTRWNESMPQYHVGHKERIKEFRDALKASYPGVYATGASFEGVGIPDCIDQEKPPYMIHWLIYLKRTSLRYRKTEVFACSRSVKGTPIKRENI